MSDFNLNLTIEFGPDTRAWLEQIVTPNGAEAKPKTKKAKGRKPKVETAPPAMPPVAPPAAAEPVPDPEELTHNDCLPAVKAFYEKHGSAELVSLFRKFDAENLPGVALDRLGELRDALAVE